MKKFYKRIFIVFVFVVSICTGNKVLASTVEWNPNDKGSNVILSNNNLTTTFNGNVNGVYVRSNKYVTSGKWYCELKVETEVTLTTTAMFGIANELAKYPTDPNTRQNELSYYNYAPLIYPTATSYGEKYDKNDVIGMAVDIDNKKIKFSKNGKWFDEIPLATWDKYYVYLSTGSTDNTNTVNTINFGRTPFKYSPPSGYLPYDNEIDSSISLSKSTDKLQVGENDKLVVTGAQENKNVIWKSSNESVATVDSGGNITAIAEGICSISATTADGQTATCVVTVTSKGSEPTDSEKIVNIAHAKGNNTNNAGGDFTIIFHGTADTTLSVVKTADVKDVWAGDNFTYTIVITNTGTKTANAVVVNDPAPNHIDFNVNGITTSQGTVDSSSTSKNIIVNVGDIPPAGTVTIRVPATVIA